MHLTGVMKRRSSECFTAIWSKQRLVRARGFVTSYLWGEEKATQPQTPATESIELTAPVTYISQSHDPWFNLSYEDWLLRTTPHHQPILFLYRNAPCVVIGRNQNPWKEANPRRLREVSIPLIRRRSGGGTVYHDMGNTNFSIILPRLLFTRAHGAELVARAIRNRLGISGCGVNERNDVVIRDGQKEYKVSGSAYKIIQHRAYHHGTMLISSSLAELGKLLKAGSPRIETKGISSFPSPVTTLNTYLPVSRLGEAIQHDDFVRAAAHEFDAIYSGERKRMETHEVSEGRVHETKVIDGAKELKSWEWQYGQTPEFTNDIEGEVSIGRISVSLTTRHALITSMSIKLADSHDRLKQEYLDALALSLIGKRYETLDGAVSPPDPHFDHKQYRELGAEAIDWLRRKM
ncbi:MAG: Biotin/lipoate A/B protein ligase [Tremellales sp. Tagirdzhanova-0007]|nr:MAG: Biotin/lipoate A/B protein ligase [Tremellales sp. Tagirdzhanova-0007]